MTWVLQKLGDASIQIIDGDRSSKYPKREEFLTEGIVFLSSTNIVDNRLQLSTANYISEEKFIQIRKGRFQSGDIVLTTRGSAIGKVAWIHPGLRGLINAQLLILRANPQAVDSRFLFSLLSSGYVQQKIMNYSSGSAQPQLPIRDLKDIEISIPALAIQQRIASILSAYDDLIENNTRRIAILEEMARRLYEEWFVRFRFPGHEGVRMVESELGLVPEGWPVVGASQAIQINPTTKVPKDGMKPFLAMNCLSNGAMLIDNPDKRDGNSGSKFRNGDTLFARITPCLENGKTGFVQFLPTDDAVAFGSTEFIVLRSRTLTPEFVYLLARSDPFRQNAIKSMSGASGRQRVREACFNTFLMANPDGGTLAKFEAVVRPVFKLIQSLAMKNANLRTTRDLLLPKLISGELEVSTLPEPQIETA